MAVAVERKEQTFNIFVFIKENIIMEIFQAGNFVIQSKVEIEERFIREAKKRYGDTFKRLVSYYFEDKTDNVLQARKNVINDSTKKEKRNGRRKSK